MVELLPYFAGFIMIIFGIAFYSAMLAFRKVAKDSESATLKDEASADKARSLKG